MTREEKITAIYKEMANKERSLWCQINVKYQWYYHWENSEEMLYTIEDDLIVWVDWVAKNGDIELNKSDLLRADPNWYIEDLEVFVKTIWHPVMIGEVLELIDRMADDRDQEWYDERLETLIGVWKIKTKPIEDQSDECIDYIYNLIQKYQK